MCSAADSGASSSKPGYDPVGTKPASAASLCIPLHTAALEFEIDLLVSRLKACATLQLPDVERSRGEGLRDPMQFSTSDDVRKAVLELDPGHFVSLHLFEPVPHAFQGDLDLWITWKTMLGEHLDVDPYNIILTGSGAIGFSLNPHKNFSPFDQDSDIDVGLVSQHHFELAWRSLRKSRPSWLSLPNSTRRALEKHKRYYVFEGTIATDIILPQLPYAVPWQGGFDEMAKQDPTRGRLVRARIYRDYEALRAYQAHGIEKLREVVLDSSSADQPLGTEESK